MLNNLFSHLHQHCAELTVAFVLQLGGLVVIISVSKKHRVIDDNWVKN